MLCKFFNEGGRMSKQVMFTVMVLGMFLFPFLSYGQYLSERDEEIYLDIIRLESQLALQNEDLMERGDSYYTDLMNANVHNVVANKYGITVDRAWDIMEQGLQRKVTPQEMELMEKINEELDALSSDSLTREQEMKLMEEVAAKYGSTVDVLYDIGRRSWQQAADDDWDDDWDDE
jgi:hypothetical protein